MMTMCPWHKAYQPDRAALWDFSPTNAFLNLSHSEMRRLRLIECHGPLYGVEEDVVLKRLSEKRYRAILLSRASYGFLVVRRNDNDARLRRNGAELAFGARDRSYRGARYRSAQPAQDLE